MFGLFLLPLTFSAVLGIPPLEGTSSPDDRIVGGKDANIADYPYQLSLIYAPIGHICGAILIDKEWALTAAHCIFGKDPEDITIRAGSSLWASGGQLVNVETIYEHEGYDNDTTYNDVALLKLAAKVTVKHSKVIPLAKKRPKTGEIATVTGWGGKHDNDTNVSPVLQVIQVPIVDQQICRYVYGNVGASSHEAVPDTVFCAGLIEGGKDSCPGDSGGPLVVNLVVAGVVSWGIDCGEPSSPGVYSDVTSYLDWIRRTKASDWCSSLHTYHKGTLI